MKKLAILALGCISIGAAMAQSGVLYTPVRTVADQGISLLRWGSGTISETTEAAFNGADSIRVSTRNLYQGGILKFAKPITLADFVSKSDALLRITFMTPTANTTMGGGGGMPGSGKGGPTAGGGLAGAGGPGGPAGPGGPGGFGGARGGGGIPGGGGKGGQRGEPGGQGGPGGPRGGGPGGPGGPAGPGGPGGFGGKRGGASTADINTDLKQIRIVISTSDGKKTEAFLPANVAGGQNGWKQVSIPVAALPGFEKTNQMVESIAISGDATTSIYVGDVRVVSDTTPITGSLGVVDQPNTITSLNLAVGDEVTFYGDGYGGASRLKYVWNFDTAADANAVDAEGQVIKRKFRKPGKYTITLTIEDYYGLKAPIKQTLSVVVNP